jgi:hypothetical protein
MNEQKKTPDEIIRDYAAAYKAAESPTSAKYDEQPLRFDPEREKYVCEYLRPVPGQRKGVKRPKMETARLEYDEETVLIMTDALRGIARGERPAFACNPNPHAGAFK